MSDSLPPHLLRAPGSAPGSAPRGRQAVTPVEHDPVSGQQDASPPVLLAASGTPGSYEPEVTGADLPLNVTDLRVRVRPATPGPWPRDAYVVTRQGRRPAHWNGTDWRMGVSPGYPAGETVAVRSETEQTTGGEQP